MSDTPSAELFVSVVIPVYDDLPRLEQCLERLARQTLEADRYEVIVVDNGANPGFEALEASHPGIRLAREPRPGSYAARNCGIILARGSLVAFTDADCLPEPTWLETALEHFRSRPEIGLLAGRIDLFFRDPGRPGAVERFEWVTEFHQREYVERYHYGATANAFVPRRIFDEVGLFDARLKSWGDQLLGERIHTAGHPIVYADDVVVRHPARNSWIDLGRKAARTVGGAYERRPGRPTLTTLAREIAADLRAPFTRYPAERKQGKLTRPLHHAQFFLVRLWLGARKAAARIALHAGRPAERR